MVLCCVSCRRLECTAAGLSPTVLSRPQPQNRSASTAYYCPSRCCLVSCHRPSVLISRLCPQLLCRLRSVYYVSAAAYHGNQLVLDTKLPFRVRVSPPYFNGYGDENAIVPLPLTLAITSAIEHKRLHPPLPEDSPAEQDDGSTTAAEIFKEASAQAASVAGGEKAEEFELSFASDDNGSLLSPPARQVFPTATLQRSFSDTSHTPHLAVLTSAPSSQSGSAGSLLDLSPASPPTPPTPDYRSLRAKIHSLRLSKVRNEPPTFPSCRPSPHLLSTFLTALRTPLSFNIAEEAPTQPTTPPTQHAPLHVTHIHLPRSAYRPGDTVRLTLNFHAATLPTYRAWLTLDWVEQAAGGGVGGRHVQSVMGVHAYCLEAVEVPLSVQLPRDATCNWASSLMRGGWQLSFHFVIGRPRPTHRRGSSGGWWFAGTADVEEERVEREWLEREERRLQALLARVEDGDSSVSSVSMAMMCAGDPNLQVSCLQWELPLNVMPFYDDSEPTPASKGVALDVEYSAVR